MAVCAHLEAGVAIATYNFGHSIPGKDPVTDTQKANAERIPRCANNIFSYVSSKCAVFLANFLRPIRPLLISSSSTAHCEKGVRGCVPSACRLRCCRQLSLRLNVLLQSPAWHLHSFVFFWCLL